MKEIKEGMAQVAVETSGHEDIVDDVSEMADKEVDGKVQVSPIFDCAMSAMERDDHLVNDVMFEDCEERLNELSGEGRWTEVPVRSGSEIFHSRMIWEPVRVLGRIEHIKGPRPVTNSEEVTYSAVSLAIRTDDQTHIETVSFPVETFVDGYDVKRLAARQKQVVFDGALIPVRRRKGGDVF